MSVAMMNPTKWHGVFITRPSSHAAVSFAADMVYVRRMALIALTRFPAKA